MTTTTSRRVGGGQGMHNVRVGGCLFIWGLFYVMIRFIVINVSRLLIVYNIVISVGEIILLQI